MYSFDVSVHACPLGLGPAELRQVRDRQVPVLPLDPRQLDLPLPLSFEAAVEAMQELPRMFVEPDGSFVWVAPAGEPAWQLDGMLWDRNQRLLRVDLKGTCSSSALDRLLAIIDGSSAGSAAQPLLFQLTREALFLDSAAFRQLLASGTGR